MITFVRALSSPSLYKRIHQVVTKINFNMYETHAKHVETPCLGYSNQLLHTEAFLRTLKTSFVKPSLDELVRSTSNKQIIYIMIPKNNSSYS